MTPRLIVHCILLLLTFQSLRAEIQPPVVSEKGPALAASVQSVSDHKKSLVIGNGDLGGVWAGGPEKFNLGLGKNDFWGVVRGSICTAGSQKISCDVLKNASFEMEQNIGPATIAGKFATDNGEALSLESWVTYPQNIVVTRLENTGSKPLFFKSEICDGYGGGLPSLIGTNQDSTWLEVSPDTVPIQIGNRGWRKSWAPFVGHIAGLTLAAPGSEKPYLSWNPESPSVRNIGALKISEGPSKESGKAVEFTGEGDHRLVMNAGCIPQKGFTLSLWVNAASKMDDGTIFSAIAVEKEKEYPFLRGFLLHIVDGKLQARLNYTTVTAPDLLPLNQWVRVKVVYDVDYLKLSADGKEIASTSFPEASGQNGWDKTALHLGDPKLPFSGCAPLGVLRQRILGATTEVKERELIFTLAPGDHAFVLLSVVSDRNAKDYLKKAEEYLALDEAGIAKLKEAHLAWWNKFWGKSFVEIPDKRIQDNWYRSLYLLACSSRGDLPAPGLWYNFVTGMGAMWDGDYTLDYNYQAPFWAALAANHFELADSYDQVLLDHIGRGRSTAENAWRIDSKKQADSLEQMLASRTKAKPEHNAGEYKGIYLYTHLIPMPGWSDDYGTFWQQKSNALFCTVNMIQRWRLTRDLEYAKKVYPFLKATAEFWDDYLVFQNGHYVALKDALCEASGDNTNPATTISFLKLLYPSLIEISEQLGLDDDRRAKWHDIVEKISPFSYTPASELSFLKDAPTESVKEKFVIRDCETNGPIFPKSAYFTYKNCKITGSSAGMSSVQTIFPGWSFGLESSQKERDAALNTVTFAAQWFDFNNSCNFYADAAAAGYDPKEILSNLNLLLKYYEQPDGRISTPGGGTEDVAIVPCALHNMFLQSYQKNIHLFPNWPMDQDASFGNLPACGGFLISSAVKNGKIPYLQVLSTAGEECRLVNPWPGQSVTLRLEGEKEVILGGDILEYSTQKGSTYTLTPH